MTIFELSVAIIAYYALGLIVARYNLLNLFDTHLSLSILFIDFSVNLSVNLLRPLQWTLFADRLSSRQWSDRRYVMTSAVVWLPCMLWSLLQAVVVGLSLSFGVIVFMTYTWVFGTPD